jgi:putative spermidine/putrescine transport system substrate-binding protein
MSDSTKGGSRGDFNRRSFIKGAAAATAAIAVAPYFINSARAAEKRIVIRDAGGPFTQGFKEAFYEPFMKETGIKVVGIASAAEPTAEIKSMVQTGNYTWDIAGAMSMSALKLLVDQGLIEPHGLDDDPAVKQIPAEYRNAYGVGSDVYSTAIGYRTDKVKRAPQSWEEFWDVKAFPGRRGLRKYPFDTIEQALMASGVKPGDVYPCDFDRAFKALDRIRPDISAWWTSGAQATQMLSGGEVDMMPTWNARIIAARDSGAPVGISWAQNIWGVDVWAILKGTPKADICRQFISFTCNPERQAAFTKYVKNGPTHPDAYKYIAEATARDLPTFPANKANSLGIDNDYWAGAKADGLDRFNEWVLG